MTIVISTSQGEKVFNKDVITVGTNPNCDVILNTGYDILLTLEYRANENKCSIINTSKVNQLKKSMFLTFARLCLVALTNFWEFE